MSGARTAQAALMGGLLYFPLEMTTAALIFSWPLKQRSCFWIRLVLSFLGCTALMAACEAMFYRESDPGSMAKITATAGTTAFWCVALFLLSVLFVWSIHAIRFREALYCGACAYLMEHLAYCVRIICAMFLPVEVMEAGAWGYSLAVAGVYAAVYLLFARQMIYNGRLAATAQGSLVLTLLTLTVVMGMSIAASSYGFEIAHACYASFCCSAVLYGQLKQQKQIKSESELALQRQMWSLQKTQYEMSKESIDIINRKCHDLKHQVAALKHIHDPERREEVINSLQSAVMIYDAALETGNEILDTVLTEKSLICTQHEIVLSCIADGQQLAFVDAVDLYSLVGNALDNAIEAVLLLPAGERFVRLRVQEKAGLVFLQIENPYVGTLETRDGLPVTRKADKDNHGFGLKSIRDIAEKYHGFLNIDMKGGIFVLRLSFPLCEQQFTAEN